MTHRCSMHDALRSYVAIAAGRHLTVPTVCKSTVTATGDAQGVMVY